MWEDETVRPNERVVAYVYARYAGSADVSWCAWDQLRSRSGIRSRDAINRALAGLLAGGWLEEVARARQHYSARYRLTIPSGFQESASQTTEDTQQSVRQTPETRQRSGKQTPEPVDNSGTRVPSSPFNETSSPFNETSSPFNGPDISNGLLRTESSKFGGTLPPDPLRPQEPPSSVLGNDHSSEPPEPLANELSSGGDPPHADARGTATAPRRALDDLLPLSKPPKPPPGRRCAHGLAADRHPDGRPRCPLCRRDAVLNAQPLPIPEPATPEQP